MSVDLSKLTDEQKVAVFHTEGAVYVSASAGSGKTKSLTSRIAHLLDLGVNPGEIVAITFTNRAAGEMRERVASMLAGARCTVQISTMHAYCAKLLRENPLAFGLENNRFTIADEDDSKRYCLQAIAMVTGKNASDVKKDESNRGPEQVRRRISQEKNQLVLPDDVVMPQHLQSYQVFLTQVYRQYDALLKKVNAVDFDDLIMKVVLGLRDPGVRGAISPRIRYLMVDEYQDTNAAQVEMVKHLASHHGNVFVVGDLLQCMVDGTPVAAPNGTIAIQDIVPENLVVSGAPNWWCGVDVPVEQVFHRNYDGPVVTITTQLGHVATATPQHCFFVLGEAVPPARPWLFTDPTTPYREIPVGDIVVGATVPVWHDHEVIDDTVVSVVQGHYRGQVHDLSVPPFCNYVAGGIFVHNSIYGFRFADPTCESKFFEAFPGAAVYTLQFNFRSTAAIAAVANQVIQGNDNTTIEKKIIATRPQGDRPQLVQRRDPGDEAEFIIGEVRSLVRRGKAEWRDCAVMYRTRFQSRALEVAAVNHGIPYRVVGSLGFYSRAIIKDVIAYLRLLFNRQDDAAFVRIHNQPRRGIGDVGMQEFCQVAEQSGKSLFRTMRSGIFMPHVREPAKAGFRQLNRIFVELTDLDHALVGPLVENVVTMTAMMSALEMGMGKNVKKLEDQREQLNELIVAAYEFDQDHGTGLKGFLDHVCLMQQSGAQTDENRFLMMTVHAAKGQEFPCVWLAGCCEGLFPMKMRHDPDDPVTEEKTRKHNGEEKRVFYVGITRAKDRLTMTWPAMRQTQGSACPTDASSLLKDVGSDLMDRVDLPAEYQVAQHQRFDWKARYLGDQYKQNPYRDRYARK